MSPHKILIYEGNWSGRRSYKVNNLTSRPLADWFMAKWPQYGYLRARAWAAFPF
jgi:hypothetical protein